MLAVLGAADADLLFGTLDAVSAGDARSALLAAARLADSGRDLGRFFGDLEAHARGLLVTQVLGEVPAELSVTPEQDERLAEQAGRVGGAELVRLLELIAFALRAMKDGADPRTQLELALVKAAKPDLEPSVKALQERIARLGAAPRPRAAAPRDAARAADAPQAAPRRAAGAPAAGRAAPRRRAAAPAGRAAPRRGAAPPAAGRLPRRPAACRRAPDAPRHARRRRPARPAPAARRASAPRRAAERGSTAVAITAQVEGQPPVAASTTLPGAGARQRGRGAAGRRPGRGGRGAGARDRGRSHARRHRRRGRRSRTRRRPSRRSRPAWSSRWTRSAACGRRSWSRCARRRRCSPRCWRTARPPRWPATG